MEKKIKKIEGFTGTFTIIKHEDTSTRNGYVSILKNDVLRIILKMQRGVCGKCLFNVKVSEKEFRGCTGDFIVKKYENTVTGKCYINILKNGTLKWIFMKRNGVCGLCVYR